ncbi:hypothetical protein [Caulobacter sp. NIBR1757]|uniref:hypothetical protein n=1 Tax=Caulobacter sp. NIBR1757 TaxID=3016000 RepID=UPI0022F04B81|nr:hypothetical protein [Caulobacter sp. NIBR1757]WGM39325.1 hypothetical protein AMEJIAPC_02243 [Caulobacter sp. NIBR1757]
MSWVLYDPPQSLDGDVDGVIIIGNTPGGQMIGLFDHLQAQNALLDNIYVDEVAAYDAATSLSALVEATLAGIENLTQAGSGIAATANPPGQYFKAEGINTDGDAFEEFWVGGRAHNGTTRYSVFVDSNGDNLYDRRIDLGPLM